MSDSTLNNVPDKPWVLIYSQHDQTIEKISSAAKTFGLSFITTFSDEDVSDFLESFQISGQRFPTMIFADVQHPSLSGFNIAKIVSNLSETPVFIMKKGMLSTDKLWGMRSGAANAFDLPFPNQDAVDEIFRKAMPALALAEVESVTLDSDCQLGLSPAQRRI